MIVSGNKKGLYQKIFIFIRHYELLLVSRQIYFNMINLFYKFVSEFYIMKQFYNLLKVIGRRRE